MFSIRAGELFEAAHRSLQELLLLVIRTFGGIVTSIS
jgi:hypothetical protein